MSKSIFAACEALAPAFRQADLPYSYRLRSARLLAARIDRDLAVAPVLAKPLGKSRDVHLTLQKLQWIDNLIIGQKCQRHGACG
jgi:hypothetical protein